MPHFFVKLRYRNAETTRIRKNPRKAHFAVFFRRKNGAFRGQKSLIGLFLRRNSAFSQDYLRKVKRFFNKILLKNIYLIYKFCDCLLVRVVDFMFLLNNFFLIFISE